MLQLSHKSTQKIKVLFHLTLSSVIAFQFLRKAYLLLPTHWLFFFTSDAVENILCAMIGYTLYYIVSKSDHLWKKIVLLLIFSAMLLSLASLKDYRIHDAITIHQTFNYFTSFLGKTVLFYSAIYFVNRLEFLNKYKKLEKELIQAKEQLLRNQLHPHFLFNAFNSLYSLSLKNHSETSEYILKLSSMMRYVTDETHLEKVPITKELDFITQYIAIEKIRFGHDAAITLHINNTEIETRWIEPFLLITLVENAFKHGFYTQVKEAFVNIMVTIQGKELVFIVKNSIVKKQHFQEVNREGKGLENLKKRLALLYPKNSHLAISTNETTYETTLTITLT